MHPYIGLKKVDFFLRASGLSLYTKPTTSPSLHMSEGRTLLLQLLLRADRSGSLDTGAILIIVHCLEVEYPGPFSGMRGLGLNSVLEDKAFGALGGTVPKDKFFW